MNNSLWNRLALPKKIKPAITVWSAAALLLLAACGENAEPAEKNAGDASDTDAEKKAPAGEQAEIDIMLDWYPNAVHSYLYVAMENGYFEEEGLEVTIQFPANPTDPINLAAAGKITLGITYQPDVVTARANQNVPVKSIAAIVRSPLNHTIFLEDSDIQTPADLAGKKVGYPGIPLNEALIKTMVLSDGGDPAEVSMIDIGFELGTSIVSKQVDAVTGAYINHEVPVLAFEGHATRYFNPVDYGVPSFYELVLVTNDATWESQEEDIRAFWRAAVKGYEYMVEHPDEALDILLNYQDQANFPLIEAVEKQSLTILLPKMEADSGFGSQDADSWQETIDWMLEYGLIDETPSLDEIFVNITE
ncbi:putative hydroxymethylpyrimidine transport system substrate-binding protein [Evansella caseinilytica]|uniref:Putative hydroxymethylpyrimidine transport system substrate-binding protein n=1 Tax=Evansella caseinilytica TaxID=1503961 RepID=A0A1H3RG67_9BACI|nr:ABC transporter substrate-binding protein [Evansella caseinilytica]SDZ24178.1 putative hydroxymethylpyrimidine transport system substrate-binding protein [Evansella caseinilytica]